MSIFEIHINSVAYIQYCWLFLRGSIFKRLRSLSPHYFCISAVKHLKFHWRVNLPGLIQAGWANVQNEQSLLKAFAWMLILFAKYYLMLNANVDANANLNPNFEFDQVWQEKLLQWHFKCKPANKSKQSELQKKVGSWHFAWKSFSTDLELILVQGS